MIIVPSLMFLLNFSQLAANSTSLGALLLPVGLLGAMVYFKARHVQFYTALWISAGLIIGSLFGAKLAVHLQGHLLRNLFGGFLLFAGFRITGLWHWIMRREQPQIQNPNMHRPYSILGLPIGLLAGILSGLFGIGGGIIIVPALVKWLRYSQKTASGTCLAALLPPVGLPGIWVYHQAAAFDLRPALLVAVGLMAGALLGAHWALGLKSHHLKQSYGVLVLLVGIKLLVGQ